MGLIDVADAGMNTIGVGADKINTARTNATYYFMDAIISHSSLKAIFSSVMLSQSACQVVRNQTMSNSGNPLSKLGNSALSGAGTVATDLASIGFTGAFGLLDVAMITKSAVAASLKAAGKKDTQELWEKALVLPNIEGIPISAPSISTTRDIDVGEQMMIVESSVTKKYWTDNAVPHLKEWNIEGYITTALSIDSAFLIRPSLKMQMDFLDTCAVSRRPVLFKDNRGEFRFVQITNLQSTEESSYNNAIKINISLKEYNPFEVENVAANIIQAPKATS